MGRHKTYSKSKFSISGLEIDVLRKNVKNLNLRVYPSDQKIRVSVPRFTPENAVIRFVEEKIPWIKKHLSRQTRKSQKPTLKFITRETHPVWGNMAELNIQERNKPPAVTFNENGTLFMGVRPGTGTSKKAAVLREWYRAELKKAIPTLIEKWEPRMGVSVKEFGVKKMKTRWGSCNIRDRRIWLNLELAKKKPALLEYVVVHEMIHLLERLHNQRFYAFMDEFLPNWKSLKNELNGKSTISDC